LIGGNANCRYLQNIPLTYEHVAFGGLSYFAYFVGKGYVAYNAGLDVLAALVLLGALLGGVRAPLDLGVEAAVVAQPGAFGDTKYYIAVVIPQVCTAIVHAGQVHGILVMD
jgi:hypothetical protein